MTRIFTFGSGQAYPNGYVVVHGRTESECRQLMFDAYGKAWSMEYDSEEAAGVQRFGLYRVATIGTVSA